MDSEDILQAAADLAERIEIIHEEPCGSPDCICYKEGYELGKIHGAQDVAGHLMALAERIRGKGLSYGDS